MKLIIFLIPLILLLPEMTFATTTKNMACTYQEWVYREALEVTWLKNASVSEFHKRDYYNHSELWYIVRQSNMYKKWANHYDDYSLYSYNCKTWKPRRSIWQMTFREVLQKIPHNSLFTDARISFIWWNYVNIDWYPDGIGCPADSCDLWFYTTSINYTPHTFTVTKRIIERWLNEYDTIGTYSYFR